MQKLALGLSLVAIVSMLSGCVGGGGAMSVAAPVWEAGYSFSYHQEGSYSAAMVQDGHSESENGKIGPYVHVFEVLNTTLEADGEPIYLAAYTSREVGDDAEEEDDASTQRATGENMDFEAGNMVPDVMFAAFRQRDLQQVDAWLDVRSDCTQNGCATSVGGLEYADMPEWTQLEFPLTKGKKWGSEIDVTSGDDLFGDIPVRFDAHVVGWKSIETPLGKVKTVQVDYVVKPVDVEKYERQTREEADDADVDLKKFNIDLEQTVSLFYSPEYQSVVKQVQRSEYEVEIQGEAQGEKFDVNMRGRESTEQMLEGVQLVPRTERGLDYIARLAAGKVKLNDPTGMAPDQVQYGIRVLADKTVVNAADAQEIKFTAQLEGVETLPADHKITWRITDLLGEEVAKGTGLTLTQKFEEPGEYQAIAEARDGAGELMSSSGVTVFANYVKTVPVECPTVALGLADEVTGLCPGVLIPVRPGIQYLKVSADVTGPLESVPVVNQAVLELSDPEGSTESDATRQDGEYSIEMFMFVESTINENNWILQLVQSRGVMEQAAYTIDLRYDAAPPMIEIDMPVGTGLRASLDDWLRN